MTLLCFSIWAQLDLCIRSERMFKSPERTWSSEAYLNCYRSKNKDNKNVWATGLIFNQSFDCVTTPATNKAFLKKECQVPSLQHCPFKSKLMFMHDLLCLTWTVTQRQKEKNRKGGKRKKSPSFLSDWHVCGFLLNKCENHNIWWHGHGIIPHNSPMSSIVYSMGLTLIRTVTKTCF